MILVEKYRPTNLDDVVMNPDLKQKFKEFIEQEHIPNLLLYGPPGTGKTTIARILINSFIKDQRDVLILNASDDRGIDTIRNKILPFLKSKPFKSKLKIVFMEEVGAPSGGLTNAAQSALLNYIEESHQYNRFIFTTNFINYLLPSLVSRFVRYYIAPVEKSLIKQRLIEILQLENIHYTDEYLDKLVNTLYPNMRDILQVIEKCTIIKENKKVLSNDLLFDSLRDLYLIDRNKLAKNIIMALWKTRHSINSNTIKSLPIILKQISDVSIDELIKYIDVNYTELDLLELIVDLKKRGSYNPTVIEVIEEILNQSGKNFET